ncbi:MAG: UDP-N-acetylmuramate dehydrogenase [Bacillota bacterium]
MIQTNIKDKFKKIENLIVSFDESMSKHTTFKVGGEADVFLVPKTEKALLEALSVCETEKIPLFVMGNGSNLVVRDKGIRGVVIKFASGLTSIQIEGNVIKAQGGVLLSKLSKSAAKHGLSGLEFAEGIPGTLGGAIAMNAGAYDGEMKNVVSKSTCVNTQGEIIELNAEEHDFGYRNSRIKRGKFYVISSELLLKPSENDIIFKKMKEFSQLRTSKQPLNFPSAGSIFKRPPGYFAGKLIEECGLKGYKIGGAEVSTKHSGFIIKSGDACAADVIELIEHIQNTVFELKGVKIETEVMIIGEE